MKNKIVKYLAIFSTIFCIIIALSVTAYYYNFYKDNQMTTIKNECITLASILNIKQPAQGINAENQRQLETIKAIRKTDLRITFISSSGVVFYDSEADSSLLDNHLSRTEVASAIQGGTGDALRYSNTMKQNMYYYAIRLDNGSVIRTSKSIDDIFKIFASSIPFVLLLIGIFIFISNFFARILTNRVVKPLNISAQQFDGVLLSENIDFDKLATYDELLPFIRKIRNLNKEIMSYTQQINAQSNTLNAITSNIQEGLILINEDKHIMSVNQGAKNMLRVSNTKDFLNQPFVSLCRHHKILDAIDSVFLNKENAYVDLEVSREFHKYFVSPISKDNKTVEGAIIFIVNATAEMKSARIRRDFASNVSHELKTPLTSISGFAEMLENSMIVNKDDVIKTAKMIHKESSRLISLINDIIRLSQIESGNNVEFEIINVSDLVNEVVSTLSHVASEKKVTITSQTVPVSIKASSAMLFELIFNICDNAIKYNKKDGSVNVSLTKEEKNAVITVSDTGIGIAQNHIDRIYERFYRVDKSRSKQTGGTGLGLSIVKHIVESMDGTIVTESELDLGTKITITLPTNL